MNSADLRYHVYQLHQGGAESEELEDEDLAAANHWILPSKDFDGIWESLVFDENIKEKVGSGSILFSRDDKPQDNKV